METKIIVTKFKLTYVKELKKEIWVKENCEEINFNSKKEAIKYLKDMKKFTNKNFNIEAIFTNENNYNEYMENWGCIKFYYKIIKKI